MDTSIRRIKKKKETERKEKKENVYGSTQWGTDMKHFFFYLITAFNCVLSNPFSFPLVIFWIVVNAQSS